MRAFNLGGFVGEVLADGKCEMEFATFIHALVGFDSEREVEGIVGVGEVHLHGVWQGQLREI